MKLDVEIIGTIASVFVLVAFMMQGEKKIRIIDAIGAVIFIIYGFVKKAPSVMILNMTLFIIQAIKIKRLSKNKGNNNENK